MTHEDAGRLRATATHLRAIADRVRRLTEEAAAYDRPDVWTGGRARQTRRRIVWQRMRVRVAAARLDAAADRIDREARRRAEAVASAGS